MHAPGGLNLIVILAVILLFLGPEKAPEIARSIGRAMNEFKRAMHDATEHFDVQGLTENRTRQNSDMALNETRAYHYDAGSRAEPPAAVESGARGAAAMPGTAGGDPNVTGSGANPSLLVG